MKKIREGERERDRERAKNREKQVNWEVNTRERHNKYSKRSNGIRHEGDKSSRRPKLAVYNAMPYAMPCAMPSRAKSV